MKDANVTGDDANLDKLLANPAGFVHGTKMFVNLQARRSAERDCLSQHAQEMRPATQLAFKFFTDPGA
jgi:hypothetical protein